TTPANRPIFTNSSRPYVVDQSASGTASSITAWITPASISTETATAAQVDQTGRIAASSRSSARRSRKPASATSPPIQNAAAARCTVWTATDTGGTGEAIGCPATGQVPSPTRPSAASSTRSDRAAAPASSGRNSSATATSTPNRTTCAVPYALASTSRRPAPSTSNRPPPVL